MKTTTTTTMMDRSELNPDQAVHKQNI